MSMIKTIHPAVIPDAVGACSRMIEDPAKFVKAAAATKAVFDYEKLKPDADHVGIHSVALGASETYGGNRNGDLFPKVACVKYHDTFVKNGAVYAHHDHDRKEKAIGKIAASLYNEPMGRIELFQHVHKKKAEPFLHKWASDGEVPGSMSCRVPGDRCTKCNTFRKSAKDPNQCDHVKYALAKLLDDGTFVGTYNDDPTFFDYSFVIKPADRIAWSLNKSAEAELDFTKISSDALAEMDRIYVPEAIALDSAAALSKMEIARKVAGYEKLYSDLSGRGPASHSENVLWEMRKHACGQALPDEAIERLRNYEPSDVFFALAKEKILLDPVSYVKYAMGLDMGSLKGEIEGIKKACAGACSRMLESGEMYGACNDSLYDVDDFFRFKTAACRIAEDYRSSGSLDEDCAKRRAILATIERVPSETAMFKKSSENSCSPLAECVARRYIAYEMAAADAMRAMDRNMTEQHYALMAARNLVITNQGA